MMGKGLGVGKETELLQEVLVLQDRISAGGP